MMKGGKPHDMSKFDTSAKVKKSGGNGGKSAPAKMDYGKGCNVKQSRAKVFK